MTAIVKQEMTMEIPAKTYLQTYEEHISGYRQYKLEKTALQNRGPVEELVPVSDTIPDVSE